MFEMLGSIFRKMESRAPDRISDETAFLTDVEKDNFSLSQLQPRREKWAEWPLGSVVLNIILLAVIVANWRAGLGPNKAYIPNEIYCK